MDKSHRRVSMGLSPLAREGQKDKIKQAEGVALNVFISKPVMMVGTSAMNRTQGIIY